VLFYRAALPFSCKILNYVVGIIRRHRKSVGSQWRKLNPGQQTLLVLASLPKGETFAEVAWGTASVRRPPGGMWRGPRPCWPPARRGSTRDKPFYAGKHKKHGTSLQVIASPDGILWAPERRPARCTTRRPSGVWEVLGELEAAGLVTLADKGYQDSTRQGPVQGKEQASVAGRGQ
jgi:hypothetical protein